MDDSRAATIVALTKDIFFSVRLGNQIRRAGFVPSIVKTTEEFREALNDPDVALGVVDLGSRADLSQLDAGQTVETPIIAFGPHKDIEAFREAKSVGITRVMSNSQFHANTIEMIQRYARTAVHKDAE